MKTMKNVAKTFSSSAACKTPENKSLRVSDRETSDPNRKADKAHRTKIMIENSTEEIFLSTPETTTTVHEHKKAGKNVTESSENFLIDFNTSSSLTFVEPNPLQIYFFLSFSPA